MLKDLLKSKKFLAAACGLLAVVVKAALDHLGVKSVTDETVMQGVGLVAAWILGQGMADLGKNKSQS